MERWDAHGNVYLVAEEPFDAERVRREVGDADGIVEVIARGDDWADVVIWNPDGSTAELSGNATRIAAAWLGRERTTVRVGQREVVARRLPDGQIEQDLGEVKVAASERVAGYELIPVDVGNPHAVVVGEQAVIAPQVVLSATVPIIDVTGAEPVEHRGYVPPRSVVVPGTRPKEFPAGTFQLACALIIGTRKESTDLRTSLNDALREYGIGTG